MTKKILQVSGKEQAKMDSFKFIQVSTIEKIRSKLPSNMNLEQILNSIHQCFCIKINIFDEDLIFDYFEQECISAHENKVLVLIHEDYFQSDIDDFLYELCINSTKYELRCIIGTRELNF